MQDGTGQSMTDNGIAAGLARRDILRQSKGERSCGNLPPSQHPCCSVVSLSSLGFSWGGDWARWMQDLALVSSQMTSRKKKISKDTHIFLKSQAEIQMQDSLGMEDKQPQIRLSIKSSWRTFHPRHTKVAKGPLEWACFVAMLLYDFN